MPEPASQRGATITTADYTAPFSTPIFPLGVGGLDLNSALDAIAVGRFSRLTNVVWNVGEPRSLTGRAGQTALATTGGTEVHSIGRMTDLQPDPPTTTYLWGVDTSLYLGASGALSSIDTGYSGNPLTFLPLRPPLSGDPWIFIGDSAKMRKVRYDGTDLEIGLAAPGAACTVAAGTLNQTWIAAFAQGVFADGTQAENWTPNAGTDYSDPPNPTDPPIGQGEVEFVLQPGTAAAASGTGFWSFWGLPATRNLDLVGAEDASDDDIIQVMVRFSHPWLSAEARLYLVCSETFSPSVLPGTQTDGTTNTDYYLRTFRPDDFAPQIGLEQAQIDAAESARVAATRDNSLISESALQRYPWLRAQEVAPATPYGRITRVNEDFAATQDPFRNLASLVSGAADAYTRFGTIGVPLRRGDFKRYGTTENRGWDTITGFIIYLQTTPETYGPISVTFRECSLIGGAGPDTMEPGAQSYDWRCTNYDPRTGAEGNPSPVMADANYLDALRRAVTVTPAAPYGDSAVRQRFYRRGGTLPTDWYYVGVNDSDGGAFTDVEADLAIAAAGTVETDHYQPVATIDDAGETVLAQPLPILFGPYNGQLMGLGDPYRPGYVYASKPGEPEHWPPDLNVEVCAPSEQLMNGCLYGGQPYVFSREAGYAIYSNLTGSTGGLTAAPTGCKHGLAGRWALALGAGSMWIVSRDNIYRTNGGPESPVANDLKPLFQGTTVNGYLPIDFTEEVWLGLAVVNDELWFRYMDSGGDLQIMVLQIQTGQWRHYTFAEPVSAMFPDQGQPVSAGQLILGGATSGDAYLHSGTSDDGAAIAGLWRTGSWDWGSPREEKLFGDQILDVNPQGVDLTLQNFLNSETTTNPVQNLTGFSGRQRVIFDSFGTTPQRARTLATEVAWSTAAAPPLCYVFGSSITMQPDLTVNRVTNWDDLGHPDEVYLMGVTFDCDTGGEDRTIIVERDFGGTVSTVATLTVNTDGRHKVKFSWAAVQANQVRIRPNDDCLAWILYRADWIWQPEPPRIARWDVFFENAWDQYYTGLDLFCDTDGQTKRIVVEVDGVALVDPATSLAYWDIATTGRQVVHLTLPWGRGHVFRFYATDAFAGLLYSHRWHLEAEPTEQANWTSPFTIMGTQADKWLKGVVMEVDTFGETKTVQVQADETDVLTSFAVTADGRQVVQVSFAQVLGRVFRFFPTDAHPSRLYSIRPIFDEEPFSLQRWETQELPFGGSEFKSIIQCQITLKSSAEVTLSISQQTSQVDGAALTTDLYTIPSTGGNKRTVFVPVNARKWILAKFLLTCASAFWLYQEETQVTIQPWIGGAPYRVHPFGNADVDPTRGMVNATLAAGRSGGSA